MRWLPLLTLAALGCSEPRVLSIAVTTGHESDAFTLDPAITRVDVEVVGPDGAVLGGASAAPGGAFSVGELSVDTLVRIEVRGYDLEGALAMRGRSLSVLLGGLAGEVWPVFAQRTERWSRPPGGLSGAHFDGAGAVLAERFLVLSGGAGEQGRAVDFYDLLSLQEASGAQLKFAPRTIVPSRDGSALLFIGDDEAYWVVFSDGSKSHEPELPQGLASWSAVAGGLVVAAPEATYVVGASRSDAESDRIVVVEHDRSLRVGKLTAPRKGAAVAFVEDRGLVVAGGSSEAPGVEIISYQADGLVLEAEARPFEPDATEGAALVPNVAGGPPLLFCGPGAAVRRLDLSCMANCVAEPLAIDFGPPLTACRGFALPEGAFVVGADQDGLFTSRRLYDDGTTASLPLREPRRGAVVVPAPNGTLAIYGGQAPDGTPVTSVETWFPASL